MPDTDETDDETFGSRLFGTGAGRRSVLRALGAGGALAAFGGRALAQDDDGDDGGDDAGGDDDNGGDDGQGGDDDNDDDGREGADHEVRLRVVEPSTNPERPADFFFQPTGLHVQPGDTVRFVFATPHHTVTAYHPSVGTQRRVPEGSGPFSSPVLGFRPDSVDDDDDDDDVGGTGDGNGDDNGGDDDADDDADDNGQGGDTDDDNDDGADDTGTDDGGEDGDDDGGDDGDDDVDDDGGGARRPVPDSWTHTFETPGVYDIHCAPHEAFGHAMRVVVGDDTEAPFEVRDPNALPEPREGPLGLARVVLTDEALLPENIYRRRRVTWNEVTADKPGRGSVGNASGTATGEDAGDDATPNNAASGP